MMFKKNAGASSGTSMLIKEQGLSGQLRQKEEEEKNRNKQRELTDFEREALEEMKKNDEEIDEMLDVVIDKLGQLKFHA